MSKRVMNQPIRISPLECARGVCAQRYVEAGVVFLAGSVVREEQTTFSDVDLVIVYERLSTEPTEFRRLCP